MVRTTFIKIIENKRIRIAIRDFGKKDIGTT